MSNRLHGCSTTIRNEPARGRWWRASPLWLRWLLANTMIAGFLGLCWLILRSGTKPSRLAYPCQQAALSATTLAIVSPIVAAATAARRQIVAGLRTRAGLSAAAVGVMLTLVSWGLLTRADATTVTILDPPPNYRATVFHVTQAVHSLEDDRFPGLDNLIELMGRKWLKFFKSDTPSMLAGPDGIIGANDTIIIKINYQWAERGGTNTDLLRGLIRNIVEHPETFIGEIVICENTQFASTDNFDRIENNASDWALSPHDIVEAFQNEGYAISTYSWRDIRNTEVDEYSNGDSRDGYVVYDFDSALQGSVSYPKFQTSYGTQISVRDGIWDPAAGAYDRQHLKFINLPVLKSHHSTYGVTACIKNYMGVVTDRLGTYSHDAIANGLMGAVLAEIGPADLNILDCIYVNANPRSGPSTGYEEASRKKQLVASTDPVAADIWATTNILIPAFEANHHSAPWPYPSADPADPNSAFRTYLDRSMSRLLDAGYSVTNDLGQIDSFSWDGSPWVEPGRFRKGGSRIPRRMP